MTSTDCSGIRPRARHRSNTIFCEMWELLFLKVAKFRNIQSCPCNEIAKNRPA